MAMNPNPQFLTTQWSMILSNSEDGSDGHSKSLTLLCERYREPVLAFIRRRISNQEHAEDLCQSFFAVLIEKRSYRAAIPESGRFRTFLKVAVKNFILNDHRDATRQKRGGGKHHVSIDSETFPEEQVMEFSSEPTEDSFFDREWANAVFDQVWGILEEDYQEAGYGDRFELLRSTLTLAEDAIPYTELAGQIDLSVNGARSAVFRLRREFRELFRAAVAQVVEKPSEVDDEIQYLVQAYAANHQS